jgi:hypothetical protein
VELDGHGKGKVVGNRFRRAAERCFLGRLRVLSKVTARSSVMGEFGGGFVHINYPPCASDF